MASFLMIFKSPELQCPSNGDLYAMGHLLRTTEWQNRMRELQGGLLFVGFTQTILGFSGVQSLLCRCLSPVVVAPTLILAGISTIIRTEPVFQSYIPLVTVMMILFALILRDICLPVLTISIKNGLETKRFPIFRTFPVLWTSLAVYVLYQFLPLTKSYPDTDYIGFQEAIEDSKWFFIPYPFEWGLPTIRTTTIIHLIPPVLLQPILSVIFFYANSSICGLGLPPRLIVSRGLGVEGLGLIFGSLWGQGVTVDSTNIGLMSLTGIVSRSSVQLAAVIMICSSCFSAFVSTLASIPAQLVYAIHLSLHISVTCVGVTILKFIDFKTSRDSYILALSFTLGLLAPKWMSNGLKFDTGLQIVDTCLSDSLSSPVFVALFTGCFLDYCIPGRTSFQKSHPWQNQPTEDQEIYRFPTWEELLCSVLDRLPFFS